MGREGLYQELSLSLRPFSLSLDQGHGDGSRYREPVLILISHSRLSKVLMDLNWLMQGRGYIFASSRFLSALPLSLGQGYGDGLRLWETALTSVARSRQLNALLDLNLPYVGGTESREPVPQTFSVA